MKASTLDTNIIVVEDFFSKERCAEYIRFSEQKGYEEAKVSVGDEQRMMKGIRNNSRIMFTDEALARQIWEQIEPFVVKKYGNAQAIGLNEMFRFYKYDPGQRFKRHRDGNYERNEHEVSFFTLMIYLNEDFDGGETKFDSVIVKPKAGTALIFEHSLKHEGASIEKGSKYVLRTDIMYKV
ncbi:MAG TPA: 2OG-Fe(II) oxygenase [Flavobacteriales bacterium]|nr:2OG-Fe(II) oxygenase [Flavobacteriales bacterium]